MLKSKKVFNVADVFLQVEWDDSVFNILFTRQYQHFICDDKLIPDFSISIELASEKRKFISNEKNNWTFIKIDKDYYSFIVKSSKSQNIISEFIFSLNINKWKLVFYNNENIPLPFSLNPFFHPIGTVIIQYALILKNAFFIHGSAINYNGKGLLFTGKSGNGKTTIAEIFNNVGTQVIHDDRLIIRKIQDTFYMFNSPMINVKETRKSEINAVFSIYHNSKNSVNKLSGIETYRNIVPNIIQHNVDKEFVSIISDTYSDFIKRYPVYSLGFVPDKNIIPFISDIISKQ